MIGPRRKTKRYDKKKRENELEKLRLENIEMLQKKMKKQKYDEEKRCHSQKINIKNVMMNIKNNLY